MKEENSVERWYYYKRRCDCVGGTFQAQGEDEGMLREEQRERRRKKEKR